MPSRSWRSFAWILGAASWVVVAAGGVAQQVGGPGQAASVPAQAGSQAQGVVTGLVVDVDGDVLTGADVQLTVVATGAVQKTVSDGEGRFRFAGLPAGAVKVQAFVDGLQPAAVTGTVAVDHPLELPAISLTIATAQFSVSAMTQAELAEVEVKQEEHQRLLGFLPNFGIAYDWNAPPLTPKQKFELATRATIDPVTLGANAGIVGAERLAGEYPEFGKGEVGFWKMYGATLADVAIGNELGGAILPSLFHQDPRYFWKGSGTVPSRFWYAISRAVVCRGDNGKNQFSYSGVLGDLGAGALSNLYYPSQDRHGAALTFENGLLDIGFDALGNVVQEFIFKHLTPSARKIQPTAPE